MEKDKNYFNQKGKNAENILHYLAKKTFLADWCYLNPKLPNKKELCDLLVIYDEIAIILQIKDLKLNNQGEYDQSEVEKNLRQLSGARRQLFDLKTPIELENPFRGKEIFNPKIIKEIYLISVLFGKGEEMSSFVEEIKNHKVHVFNNEFCQIVLNELDTISDFVKYLREKEILINKNKSLLIVGGEKELLAFYLINNRSFNRFDNADHITIEGGSWEHLQNRPEYQAKKKEDKISYLWDGIISRAHESSSKEYEMVARELARPNRVQRRLLSKVFLDARLKAHKDNTHNIFRRIVVSDDATYCFLLQDDPEPRQRRKEHLGTICFIARGKNKKNKKVIGIATEKKNNSTCSYDFCLMYIPEWNNELQKKSEDIQKKYKLFLDSSICHIREEEYPIQE
jgi:hypothetical protein